MTPEALNRKYALDALVEDFQFNLSIGKPLRDVLASFFESKIDEQANIFDNEREHQDKDYKIEGLIKDVNVAHGEITKLKLEAQILLDQLLEKDTQIENLNDILSLYRKEREMQTFIARIQGKRKLHRIMVKFTTPGKPMIYIAIEDSRCRIFSPTQLVQDIISDQYLELHDA